MANKIYYTESNGKRRYSNLTQQDRIMLRNASNQGRPLTPSEKEKVFGVNPKFVKTN